MGSELYESTSVLDGPELDLQVFTRAVRLRPAIAALDIVQLALHSASIAIEYVEATGFSGGAPDLAELTRLAADTPTIELQILELNTGSLFARLRPIFTSRAGDRSSLRS
jgi:hypothetical protein